MKKHSVLAFLAVATAAVAQQSGHKISMVFTDTDVAYVLQAISKQTGENILYNNKTKTTVTINLAVDTVDEAIRAVSSAGSLVYRRVGSLYVVAPAASMKDALAPYAHTSTFNVDPGTADTLAPKLQDAYPYATIRAVGDKISVTGLADDIDGVGDMINETSRALRAQRIVEDIVMMHTMGADEAAPLLKGLYPGLEVTSTAPSTRPAQSTAVAPGETPSRISNQNFGAVGLRGPEALVRMARATLEKLDSPMRNEGPNRIVTQVYKLKYMNGPSLTTFLRKAEPYLDVYTGPEEFSPPRAAFNPISQDITSGSASGSTGSTGTSSGGSSGGSTGSTGGGSPSGGGSTSGSGSTGSTGLGGAGQSSGGRGAAGDRAKAIVLRGREDDVASAMKLLEQVDVKPRQVVIEVKVIETSPTDSAALGVAYTFSPVNFYDVAPGSLLTNVVGAVGQTAGSTQVIAPGGTGFSRTPLNFQATLSAMVTKQTAKLLATPSLQVVDNDEGSIFIGNTVSVELSSTTSLGAVSQSIAQFPVGIILLISPRISDDGNVTIHVNPVISTISSLNSDGIPQTSSREAETTMIIKDGQTMVLGGLIQDQDSKTISSVPWLSSLPIIGELFKNRTSTRTREDILVSITPHIVKDPDTSK